MEGKLFIFSAPSGSGKTTIVRALLKKMPQLEFSISATSRPKRPNEQEAKDYYFMSSTAFRKKMRKGEFLEWEEVYKGNYYGTLFSEVKRIWAKGHHVVFDVDVAGGIHIKKQFGDKALSIFILPPSLEELERRLVNRKTETPVSLRKRLDKAKFELSFSKEFDRIVINDELESAIADAEKLILEFLKSP